MNYFVFENPGVIDPRSITTFGVSSKADASKAIGFFGTGLKYAIAILLRNGCSIQIYSGGKKYSFGILRETIRNDEFNIITMSEDSQSPQKLGFTTELGKTWEMWQALRELHCNCADEGGTSFEEEKLSTRVDASTRVVVQGAAFEDVWRQRGSIFLVSAPIYKDLQVEIHPGQSEWIYYRGIRTHKLPAMSRHTYNILEKMDLTEDRTFRNSYYTTMYVGEMFAGCTDEKLVEQCITEEPHGYWEHSLHFSSTQLGQVFQSVAIRCIKEMSRRVNSTIVNRLRDMSFDKIVSDDTDKLTKIDKMRMEKAITFLKGMGWDVTIYPIIVSENIGENVLGRAHEGKIYIAQRTFMMGTKMLAGTLLEEYIHLKHGHDDCDRPMQNWLFDALMSAGELITGEVL